MNSFTLVGLIIIGIFTYVYAVHSAKYVYQWKLAEIEAEKHILIAMMENNVKSIKRK